MSGLPFLWLADVPWYGWVPPVFILGAAIGSFVNVCIYRLPLEKSILWPGSHCGHCFQAIRWYDNLPLLSYVMLRGRCRRCGTHFSIRYFFIELFTALSFVSLYYLEVVRNVGGLDLAALGPERFALGRLVLFAYHATLFCFLLVASMCDFDYQIIPLSLTITGTLVGLIGSVLWPWPWPYAVERVTQAMPTQPFWFFMRPDAMKTALYPWPVWWPLPHWLPAGSWQSGLATGLVGFLVGTLALRAVRFLFGFGRGAAMTEPEDPAFAETPRTSLGRWLSWFQRVGGRAMGLGDADLMMMAGAFLGWQVVLVSFFVGVFAGLFLGVAQLLRKGNQPFAFGPALAIGVVITWLNWSWLGPRFLPLFFDGTLMLILFMAGCIFLPLAGFILRFFHREEARPTT